MGSLAYRRSERIFTGGRDTLAECLSGSATGKLLYEHLGRESSKIAVLVTSLDGQTFPTQVVPKHYRDRADAENCFDRTQEPMGMERLRRPHPPPPDRGQNQRQHGLEVGLKGTPESAVFLEMNPSAKSPAVKRTQAPEIAV
jgi:hypothetical protein